MIHIEYISNGDEEKNEIHQINLNFLILNF